MKKLVMAVWCMAVLLAGCGDKTGQATPAAVTCGDEQAQAGVRDAFLRELKNQAALGLDEADLNKVTAAAATLQLSLFDVRTDSSDPTHQKAACKAMLKITLPPAMQQQFADVGQAMPDLASTFGHEGSSVEVLAGNTIQAPVAYAVQRTDDGQSLYIEAELYGLGSEFAVLLTPLSDTSAQAAAAAHPDGMSIEQLQQLRREAESREIENRIAHAKLNTLWQDLPADVRTDLRAEQQAWLADIRQQCMAEAEAERQESEVNYVDQGQRILACNTRKVEHRYQILQPYHIRTPEYEAKEEAAVNSADPRPEVY